MNTTYCNKNPFGCHEARRIIDQERIHQKPFITGTYNPSLILLKLLFENRQNLLYGVFFEIGTANEFLTA